MPGRYPPGLEIGSEGSTHLLPRLQKVHSSLNKQVWKAETLDFVYDAPFVSFCRRRVLWPCSVWFDGKRRRQGRLPTGKRIGTTQSFARELSSARSETPAKFFN